MKKDEGYCQSVNQNDNFYLDVDDNTQNVNPNQEKVEESFNKIR
jgi:hypothetical protein